MVSKIEMSTEVKVEPERSRSVGGMFRALRHRNFLLFWSGAFLSNTGTWMQAVAQGWLVFELSNSPFWLGVDGFMSTAPGLVLTLAGGVIADLALVCHWVLHVYRRAVVHGFSIRPRGP